MHIYENVIMKSITMYNSYMLIKQFLKRTVAIIQRKF